MQSFFRLFNGVLHFDTRTSTECKNKAMVRFIVLADVSDVTHVCLFALSVSLSLDMCNVYV